jgi:hypothetical protein
MGFILNWIYSKVYRESDMRLKEKVRTQPNGEYAVQICRRCEGYLSDRGGDIENVKFVSLCEGCKGSWR